MRPGLDFNISIRVSVRLLSSVLLCSCRLGEELDCTLTFKRHCTLVSHIPATELEVGEYSQVGNVKH
jgi:hypothetical protein